MTANQYVLLFQGTLQCRRTLNDRLIIAEHVSRSPLNGIPIILSFVSKCFKLLSHDPQDNKVTPKGAALDGVLPLGIPTD
jgi:hypothetical protein